MWFSDLDSSNMRKYPMDEEGRVLEEDDDGVELVEDLEEEKEYVVEKIYFDETALSPPPRRDYYRLLVTSKVVQLTQWSIGHRIKRTPNQLSVPLDIWSSNQEVVDAVKDVFGMNTVDYINNLSIGKVDWINHLPDDLLAKIVVFVGIKQLNNLSAVSRKFKKICSSDLVWKEFFNAYKGERVFEHDIAQHAMFTSWKTLFFMNGLEEDVFPGKKMVFGHDPSNPYRQYANQLRIPMQYRPWALTPDNEKAQAGFIPGKR